MEDFKKTLTQDSYIRQAEVAFGECDRSENMRVTALLGKIASFGGYHYDALGFPREKLRDMGVAFLLSRVAVRIHRLPAYGDLLTTETWENGAKGVHVQRVFEMTDQTGRLCVSAKGDWILVDPASHRLLRPAAFTARPYGICPKEIDCPEPRKIVLPKEGLEDRGAHIVRWSELDGNGHLYSARYGDIVWDALPAELQDCPPREFYINYSKEGKLGEELRLAGFRDGGNYFMEGVGPAGVCFAALCVYGEETGNR